MEGANVDSHALIQRHRRPPLHPPRPTTIRPMKTWTIAPVVMDSMPPRGGERIIKTVPGVMRCFKKKIIGRYPRSFLGQGRCHSRVVSLPFLLVSCSLDLLSLLVHHLFLFHNLIVVVSFVNLSKQANSHQLPSTQFWIIRTTTSPSQSCTSKDSGVTTSRSATNCRNRPPKIRKWIPPNSEPKG